MSVCVSDGVTPTHLASYSPTDNGYEIGQEPEYRPWGTRTRGRRRKRSLAGEREVSEEEVWVTKRKRKLSGMISECRKVLSRAGDAGGTSGHAEDLSSTGIDDETTPIKSSQVTLLLLEKLPHT